jgi:hypothetical protein
MKLLLTSVFALLTFAAAAQVQRRPGDSTPTKGQNTIIVTLPDTTTFEHIAGTLLDAGYAIVALDRQLGFVTTAPTPYSESSRAMMVVSARKKGHRAIFSAALHSSLVPSGGAIAERVTFTDHPGKSPDAPFEALHRLAYALGGRIDYETR